MPVDRKSSVMINNKPVYVRLPFTIITRGNLESLVNFLDYFYNTPLLQQVTDISVQRPTTNLPQQGQNELDIKITVEALIVAGAEVVIRPKSTNAWWPSTCSLACGPARWAWLSVPGALDRRDRLGPTFSPNRARNYSLIAQKNIFYGRPNQGNNGTPAEENIDPRKYVRLVSIVDEQRRSEAFLFSPYDNANIRLRDEAGFDRFRVLDEEGEPLLTGKVIKICTRDVVFRVDEDYYSIHMGQSILDALKHKLTSSQLTDLGVVSVAKKDLKVGG